MIIQNDWKAIRAGRKARRMASKLSPDEKRALHQIRAAHLAIVAHDSRRFSNDPMECSYRWTKTRTRFLKALASIQGYREDATDRAGV